MLNKPNKNMKTINEKLQVLEASELKESEKETLQNLKNKCGTMSSNSDESIHMALDYLAMGVMMRFNQKQ
jgi:hypothetical protein